MAMCHVTHVTSHLQVHYYLTNFYILPPKQERDRCYMFPIGLFLLETNKAQMLFPLSLFSYLPLSLFHSVMLFFSLFLYLPFSLFPYHPFSLSISSSIKSINKYITDKYTNPREKGGGGGKTREIQITTTWEKVFKPSDFE